MGWLTDASDRTCSIPEPGRSSRALLATNTRHGDAAATSRETAADASGFIREPASIDPTSAPSIRLSKARNGEIAGLMSWKRRMVASVTPFPSLHGLQRSRPRRRVAPATGGSSAHLGAASPAMWRARARP